MIYLQTTKSGVSAAEWAAASQRPLLVTYSINSKTYWPWQRGHRLDPGNVQTSFSVVFTLSILSAECCSVGLVRGLFSTCPCTFEVLVCCVYLWPAVLWNILLAGDARKRLCLFFSFSSEWNVASDFLCVCVCVFDWVTRHVSSAVVISVDTASHTLPVLTLPPAVIHISNSTGLGLWFHRRPEHSGTFHLRYVFLLDSICNQTHS